MILADLVLKQWFQPNAFSKSPVVISQKKLSNKVLIIIEKKGKKKLREVGQIVGCNNMQVQHVTLN